MCAPRKAGRPVRGHPRKRFTSHLYVPLARGEDPGRDVADDVLSDVPRDLILCGEAGPRAGDEQVVERRVAVERHIVPRAERGLLLRELLRCHLIVSVPLEDQHRRLHCLAEDGGS
jgi:hypothetical protein